LLGIKKYKKSFFRKVFKIKKYKTMICFVIGIYKDANIKTMTRSFIMIKKLGIALLCAALGTTLYAREDISTSKLFVGLELASTKADSSMELYMGNTLVSPKFTDTSGSVFEYGVRLGAEKEDWRTTLLYTYYNNTEEGIDETMHKGSMLLDYFLLSTGSAEYNVKPYIGAHVGYMTYEASGPIGNTGFTGVYADDSGLFYGGQAGIAMTIAEVVELDLSYKYSLTSLDDISQFILSDTKAVTSIDNMGSIVFAINYFY
jgi:hypothetical protein